MRRGLFVVMSLLSIMVSTYAIGVYGFGRGAGNLPSVFQDSFRGRPLAVAAHIFASATALLLGPAQFSTRARWPALHRIIGRVYLGVAVPIGGLAGLYLSGFAFGGVATKLGFGCLAVVWLYTAFRGYMTAHAGDFSAHRRWMIRNYSLTFAAVTLRLYLPLAYVLQVPFELSYQLISWLCWAPNLIAGECMIRVLRAPATERPIGRSRRASTDFEYSATGRTGSPGL